MFFCTLASGSDGNSAFISSERTRVLIDAGISARRIINGLKSIDIAPDSLEAILITHEHSDHIKGLSTLIKRCGAKVYAPEDAVYSIIQRTPGIESRIVAFSEGGDFNVGDLHVDTFATPHDSIASAGFSIRAGEKQISCVTDLGYVPDHVKDGIYGSDLIMVEANHDIDRLKSGPYPYFLKRRILGDHGHLSNSAGGELAALASTGRTRQIVLAHLSRKNNTPYLAKTTVADSLSSAGAVIGRDLNLAVAPADEMGEVYIV